MTELNNEIEKLGSPISSELWAVLRILSEDDELFAKVLPFVNIGAQEIDWFGVGQNHFGSGHSVAIMWAKAIWNGQFPQNYDLFEHFSSMNLDLRKAVLDALAIAWGIV